MNIKNVKVNKVYFKVTVGRISKIKVLAINDIKIKYIYVEDEKYKHFPYVDEIHFSDCGIRHKNEKYINITNGLFKTEKQAQAFISSTVYKDKLADHFRECDLLDELFDEYIDNDINEYYESRDQNLND